MVKFYCNDCGKELFQLIDEADKKSFTIYEIEKRCICSDCLLKRLKKEEEK